MRPGADLSVFGVAGLLGEFIERLDLSDVALVCNEWGGPLLMVQNDASRICWLVITSYELFDNIPPGLAGRLLWLAGHIPGGINSMVQPLRWCALRRLPITFGSMSMRRIPDEITDAWLTLTLTSSEIRRDIRKYVCVSSAAKAQLRSATACLQRFPRQILILWAAEDRLMPVGHDRKLVGILREVLLEDVADSYTLIPEDQPEVLSRAIRNFVQKPDPVNALLDSSP